MDLLSLMASDPSDGDNLLPLCQGNSERKTVVVDIGRNNVKVGFSCHQNEPINVKPKFVLDPEVQCNSTPSQEVN